MKWTMIDNAVDSLKLTMDFFDLSFECSDKDAERYDKLIIIFLHNAVELLLKSILVRDDELSIYELKNDTTEDIIERAKECVENNPQKSIHEILIQELDVQTIPYRILVNKYVLGHHCDKKTDQVLQTLGKYRNAITHFGIDNMGKEDEFYCIVYETFKIIINELYDDLILINEYFEYNDVIDNLESWIEGSENFLTMLSIDNASKKIKKFLDLMKQTFYSKKLKCFLDTYNIKMDLNLTKFEDNRFIIYFSRNGLKLSVSSHYSPFHNATILFNEDCEIWFVIEHYDDKIYLYDLKRYYDWMNEEYRIWEKDVNVYCKSKPLTENNIRNHIIYILRKNLIE